MMFCGSAQYLIGAINGDKAILYHLPIISDPHKRPEYHSGVSVERDKFTYGQFVIHYKRNSEQKNYNLSHSNNNSLIKADTAQIFSTLYQRVAALRIKRLYIFLSS